MFSHSPNNGNEKYMLWENSQPRRKDKRTKGWCVSSVYTAQAHTQISAEEDVQWGQEPALGTIQFVVMKCLMCVFWHHRVNKASFRNLSTQHEDTGQCPRVHLDHSPLWTHRCLVNEQKPPPQTEKEVELGGQGAWLSLHFLGQSWELTEFPADGRMLPRLHAAQYSGLFHGSLRTWTPGSESCGGEISLEKYPKSEPFEREMGSQSHNNYGEFKSIQLQNSPTSLIGLCLVICHLHGMKAVRGMHREPEMTPSQPKFTAGMGWFLTVQTVNKNLLSRKKFYKGQICKNICGWKHLPET